MSRLAPAERRALVEALAASIRRRALAEPALFALEIIAPLDLIASQSALFISPLAPGGVLRGYLAALDDPQGWAALREALRPSER